MKASTFLKSGVGLVYTTILIAALYMGIIWLTRFVVNFTWTGALLFWGIGLPIVVGLFQFIATFSAIPVVHLMKGAKWLSWLLVLPALFFVYSLGAFLWKIASSVGGVLIWLLMISWFAETAYLFVSYLYIAIGSAYEKVDTTEALATD